MTPAQWLATYRRRIAEFGQSVSIRRYVGTGPTATYTDTSTTGYVRHYGSKELIGAIVQGDQVAIVLVDNLSAILPVKTSDKLVIGGREFAIKNPMPRTPSGTLVALEIHAAG